MSPITASMAHLEPGRCAWVETTVDGYRALMSQATTRARYHRSIRGRTFSAHLFVAVHGTEITHLVRITRLT